MNGMQDGVGHADDEEMSWGDYTFGGLSRNVSEALPHLMIIGGDAGAPSGRETLVMNHGMDASHGAPMIYPHSTTTKRRRVDEDVAQPMDRPFVFQGEDFKSGCNNEMLDHASDCTEKDRSPQPEKGACPKLLKVPEVIEVLAQEGRVLQYVESTGCYVVMDGKMFEEAFNRLRRVRSKKNEAAKDRPFSRMYTHFTLVQGERWGGTGTIFRPKCLSGHMSTHQSSITPDPGRSIDTSNTFPSHSPPSPQSEQDGGGGANFSDISHAITPPPGSPVPHQRDAVHSGSKVTGDDVQITLKGHGETFQVSLQYFLDVTGAGEAFMEASNASQASSSDAAMSSRPPRQPMSNGGVMQSAAGIDDFLARFESSNSILSSMDVASIVGGLWNAQSKGDQAYFFRRADGVAPFANGSIVFLSNGLVNPDTSSDGICMVVSDDNAKWKGEPLPTPEEETLGHWCCFLGQVPVRVEGRVRCGDYIGPQMTGRGLGKVVELGRGPVTGIALENKDYEGIAVLKTCCFVGLNAVSDTSRKPEDGGGSVYKQLWQEQIDVRKRMNDLSDNLEKFSRNLNVQQEQSGAMYSQMDYLSRRMFFMESVMRRMMGRPHQHNDIEMGHLVLTAEQRDAMSQNNMPEMHFVQTSSPVVKCFVWFKQLRATRPWVFYPLVALIFVLSTALMLLIVRRHRHPPPFPPPPHPPPAFPFPAPVPSRPSPPGGAGRGGGMPP